MVSGRGIKLLKIPVSDGNCYVSVCRVATLYLKSAVDSASKPDIKYDMSRFRSYFGELTYR